MKLTREQLYADVWAAPMTELARRYSTTGTALAQECDRLRVPRPARGYWSKLKFGKAPAKPDLPELPPAPPDYPSSAPAKPSSPEPSSPAEAPGPDAVAGAAASATSSVPPIAPKRRRRSSLPARHPVVAGVQSAFETVRKGSSYSDDSYLRPLKRKLPDIFVSKELLPRALDVANELYLSLEARGLRVELSLGERPHYYRRPALDHRAKPKQDYGLRVWAPSHSTVTLVGRIAIGLSLYEIAEEVEVRWVNGKYVRVPDLVATRARRGGQSGYSWTSTRDLPSGRLALRAYSPYSGVDWQESWSESKPGQLVSRIPAVCKSIVGVAPELVTRVTEEDLRRERERAQAEIQYRKWREQEAERQRAEAIKASKEHLLKVIEQWATAVRVEAFFAEVATRAETAGPGRDVVLAKLRDARALFGGIDALTHLASWRTPRDRLGLTPTDNLVTRDSDPLNPKSDGEDA